MLFDYVQVKGNNSKFSLLISNVRYILLYLCKRKVKTETLLNYSKCKVHVVALELIQLRTQMELKDKLKLRLSRLFFAIVSGAAVMHYPVFKDPFRTASTTLVNLIQQSCSIILKTVGNRSLLKLLTTTKIFKKINYLVEKFDTEWTESGQRSSVHPSQLKRNWA